VTQVRDLAPDPMFFSLTLRFLSFLCAVLSQYKGKIVPTKMSTSEILVSVRKTAYKSCYVIFENVKMLKVFCDGLCLEVGSV